MGLSVYLIRTCGFVNDIDVTIYVQGALNHMLDQVELKKILPQAYPFLMLDYVQHVQPSHSLIASKNITANEWPFTDSECRSHYPEVLLIEAAAQAALVFKQPKFVKQ